MQLGEYCVSGCLGHDSRIIKGHSSHPPGPGQYYICRSQLDVPNVDAFELWCWRRLLRVPWTARRPKQSTLKETNPEDSLERLIPKLHYSGLLCKESTHWKDWCLERFRAEGEEGSRGWVGWMASSAQWAWVWANSLKIVKDREAWHAAVHGVEKSQTRLSNWTTIRKYLFLCFSSQKFISM